MGPGLIRATGPFIAAALFAGGCSVEDREADRKADRGTPSVQTARTGDAERPVDATFRGVVACDVAAAGGTIHLLLATVVDPAVDQKELGLSCVRSDDGGVTWSAPVAIPTGHGTPAKMHRGDDPQIAVAGNHVMALWTARGDGPFGSGPLATALSEDGGRTWRAGPAPSALPLPLAAEAALAADAPKKPHAMNGTGPGYRFPAAAAADDAFHVIWIHAIGEERSLRHARLPFPASRWSDPLVIDPEICACCWNELRAEPDGTLLALYRDQQPSDMSLARSRDGGRTWESPERAGDFDWHFDGCPHVGGGVATVRDGDRRRIVTTVWTGKTGGTGAYVVARDASGSWSAPVPLAAGRGTGRHTDVAALDGNGTAAVVWDQPGTEGGQSVFAVITADGGKSWDSPVRLSAPGENASYPRVAVAGGGFVVVYSVYETDGTTALRVKTMGRND